jgi:hypothetical protein
MKNLNNLLKAGLAAATALLCFSSQAQPWRTRQAIIVSGGDFGVPGNYARVYSYRGSGTLTVIDSMKGNFTDDATTYNGYAYLNIDSTLYSYDLTTINGKRKDSTKISNLTQLDHSNQYLIALRGYAASDYLHVYALKDLSLQFTDTSLHGAKSMKVINDTLYVAADNNGSGGSIYEYALTNPPAFVKKTDFNYSGATNLLGDIVADRNLIYLMSDKYAFVQGFYVFDRKKGTIDHDSALTSNTALWAENGVVYANFGAGLYSFDTKTKTKTLIAQIDYNNGAYDTLTKQFYLVKGDFSHPDTVFVYTKSGHFVNKFASGVSSQAVALDYRNENAIEEENIVANDQLGVYPNPATSQLYIRNSAIGSGTLTVRNLTGQTIAVYMINATDNAKAIDISQLPAGLYCITLQNADKQLNARFIKE